MTGINTSDDNFYFIDECLQELAIVIELLGNQAIIIPSMLSYMRKIYGGIEGLFDDLKMAQPVEHREFQSRGFMAFSIMNRFLRDRDLIGYDFFNKLEGIYVGLHEEYARIANWQEEDCLKFKMAGTLKDE